MIIRIDDTGISHGVLGIANQLPNPSTVEPGSEVVFRFSRGEFVFVTGLVLLAAWRKALPAGVVVRVDDDTCFTPAQRFLTNTGFREIIETGHETPSTQRRIGRVPLQPITNQFTKEATVNDLVAIFEEYAGHVDDSNPFRVMISELCENVLAHSEFTSPGYVCARVLEGSGKAEIAIADTGVGVHQSYLNGTNDSAKERIDKGASALQIAVDGLNSSKPRAGSGSLTSYYGFGLLVTRRLVEENRGQLFLLSGQESLHIHRYQRSSHPLNNPWSGTFIGVVLDLANPLPLEEIYDQATGEYAGLDDAGKYAGRIDSPRQGSSITERESMSEKSVPDSVALGKSQNEQRKSIQLRHYGTELLTRDAGTAIRADIASYLAAGYSVDVSLEEVTDITPSVADEAFAKLAEIIGHSVFEDRVNIIGGSRLARRLVTFVLRTRQSRAS